MGGKKPLMDVLAGLPKAQRQVCDQLGVEEIDLVEYSDAPGEFYYQCNVSWMHWEWAPGTYEQKETRLRQALGLTPATDLVLL